MLEPFELWLGMHSVGFSFLFFPVMLPSEIPKLPTDLPVRGFPTVFHFYAMLILTPAQFFCSL